MALAPSRLSTEVDGTPVRMETVTEYPFGESVRFEVEVDAPVRFALAIRVPGWADGARLVDDASGREERVSAGSFWTVDRAWAGRTSLTLRLPAHPRLLKRPGGAVAVKRGALVYALAIGERWERIERGQAPPRAAARGLGGPPHHALELRARCGGRRA